MNNKLKLSVAVVGVVFCAFYSPAQGASSSSGISKISFKTEGPFPARAYNQLLLGEEGLSLRDIQEKQREETEAFTTARGAFKRKHPQISILQNSLNRPISLEVVYQTESQGGFKETTPITLDPETKVIMAPNASVISIASVSEVVKEREKEATAVKHLGSVTETASMAEHDPVWNVTITSNGQVDKPTLTRGLRNGQLARDTIFINMPIEK